MHISFLSKIIRSVIRNFTYIKLNKNKNILKNYKNTQIFFNNNLSTSNSIIYFKSFLRDFTGFFKVFSGNIMIKTSK